MKLGTRHHLIAGLTGSGWTALMSVAFIPIYITQLGPEQYGLIGVYIALTGSFAILDLGLSQSLSKLLAGHSGGTIELRSTGNAVKTLEVIYLLSAVLIFSIIYSTADAIAQYWLIPKALSSSDVSDAIVLIGAAIATRWPISLYSGGLQGLHLHVRLNTILMIATTFQSIGAAIILVFVSPTINAFMLWQIAIGLLHATTLRYILYRAIISDRPPTFDIETLRPIWRFAAGITSISLLSTLITQLDKFVLSKVLPLDDFGHYAFASAIASILFRIASPLFNIYFPKFSQLASAGSSKLSRDYHTAAQLMTCCILPLGLTLAAFSEPIVALWSSDADLANSTHLLIATLLLGNILNCFLYIPYAAQLANNITRIAIYQNTIALCFLLPALYFSTTRFGALGAAFCWVILNVASALITIPYMHRHLLKWEMRPWYLTDIGLPICINLLIFGFAFTVHRELSHTLWSYALIVSTLLISIASTILALPIIRARILQLIKARGILYEK